MPPLSYPCPTLKRAWAKPTSALALTTMGERMPDLQTHRLGMSAVTASGDSVAKHAALHPVHLDEQMSVTQLVQRLEALHFDSHEEARVMIDPGVQAFLIRASKAPPLIISIRKFVTRGA